MPSNPAVTSKPRALRAVFVDAGNTLFYESPSRFEVYAAQARDLGLPVDDRAVRRAMGAAHDRLPWLAGERVRYTDAWFRHYVPAVYRELGATEEMTRDLTDRLLIRFRETAKFHLFPETLEVLDAIRSRGLKLCVVSNWSPRLTKHLDALGLSVRFDRVWISAVVGLEKPAPAFFEHGCRELGIRPDEAVHVGDHPVKDVAGARAAGIRAFLIDREGESTAPDVAALRSLRELIPQIDLWQ